MIFDYTGLTIAEIRATEMLIRQESILARHDFRRFAVMQSGSGAKINWTNAGEFECCEGDVGVSLEAGESLQPLRASDLAVLRRVIGIALDLPDE